MRCICGDSNRGSDCNTFGTGRRLAYNGLILEVG
jgi:hypothetical protein